MNYMTKEKCKLCGANMTLDDINNYKEICFSCCAKFHGRYEKAHSGESMINYKRKPISKNLKTYIMERDGSCLRCGSDEDLTIDHVTPVSAGGENTHDNLQVLCRICNSKKSDYPADYREVIE